MALLSTEDSNDSQKRMRAVLTIHPTLAYPFFSFIRRPTPVSPRLAQRGSDMRGSTVLRKSTRLQLPPSSNLW